MTANPHRGEVEVVLSGRPFLMRPNYAAIVEFETVTGFGAVELFNRIHEGRYTHRDIVAIVAAGVKAIDPRATDKKVGEMLVDTGVLNVIPAVAMFLENALTGGAKPGKDQAAAGRKKSPTAA